MSSSDSRSPTKKKARPAPKRRRRSPESARRAILDAAGSRLTRDGADGLRLQAIAADLGIAHSSILHHFGSREGLLEALSIDAFDALERDLRSSLESTGSGEHPATALLERVARTLRDQGHARLLAWQIMSGRLPREPDPATPDAAVDGAKGETRSEASNQMLARIADVVHRVRIEAARNQQTAPPDLEDTRFFVFMIACTLFGEALAGDVLSASADLETTDAAKQRFRRWFGDRSEGMLLGADRSPDARTPRG